MKLCAYALYKKLLALKAQHNANEKTQLKSFNLTQCYIIGSIIIHMKGERFEY